MRISLLAFVIAIVPLTAVSSHAVTTPIGNPVMVGDVVAKALNRTGMENLGHVGIYAAPNKIVQVNNGTAFVNVVQNVSVDTFKQKTYWGAKAKPNFLYKAPYKSASEQIQALASQQAPHVSYDLFNFTAKPATMTCQSYANGQCTNYKWSTGVFRCDTFVNWLYQQTGNGALKGMYPADMFKDKTLSITRT